MTKNELKTGFAGTSPASGVSLLASALSCLADKGCKVVCTTHFLELFSMGLIPEADNAFRALRMAVHIPENDKEQATPLFRLEVGVASSSAGIVCAEMAGVKPAVIARAREIVQATREKRKVSPLSEILRVQMKLTEEACSVLSQFLEKDPNEMTDDEIGEFVMNCERNLPNKRVPNA